MVVYLTLFVAALVSALATTPRIVRTCHRLRLLDLPGGRKVHTAPIPRLGGVAIALGLIVALGAAVVIDAHSPMGPNADPRSLLPIMSGAVLVFAIGAWDDLDPIGPGLKLLVEAAAAAIVIAADLTITRATFFGTTYELGWIAIPATALWIVVITNAFNLIDGLDGLAGGLIAIAAATCATVLIVRDQQPSAMLLVSLLGAVLGFLAYNFHPARIFLGDSGSLLAGFLLAVTAITGQQKGATTLAVGMPLLIFAVPLADTVIAIGRRLFRRGDPQRQGLASITGAVERVFAADRAHIHHRLLGLGFSHRAAVLALYGLMLLCSVIALLTMDVP
jgi:UDP-GlcNAc:undecaprenyl-phosphate/decaprenyl-phosphate GlcNAc-1-phosphate transferase